MTMTSTISPPKILSDEPKLSSAALCTTLKHLNQLFRPEFTHQCVENETFRGHQPLESVLEQATQKEFSTEVESAVLHKSHLHHEQATSQLEITIELAPSCRTCRLQIVTTTNKKRKTNENGGNDGKRQKLNDSTNLTTQNTTTTKVVLAAEMQPMSKTEIQNSIAKALPVIVEDDCNSDVLANPIGTVLREYAIQDQPFCLSLANGCDPAVAEYHGKIQKLALWFIENADDVDVSEEDSGHWKVLYLFCKSQNGYALVGYCTLFHFNSPFHKPIPGTIVRICQALVLPPFQGQGHGRRMMECLYDAIHNKIEGAYVNDQEVVQINVEDPAPGFVALRNKVDWKLFKDHPEFWSSSEKVDIAKEAFFASIPEAEAVQVAARAKVTPHQVHIVHEIQTLEALHGTIAKGSSGVDKEELEKRHRLLVKRRLNRDHREDLSSFATKDAKKAYLAKLFDEQLVLYNKLLKVSKR